jgi:hypothetical protein
MKSLVKKTKTEVQEKVVLDYLECDICGERCPTNQRTEDFDSDGYAGAQVLPVKLPQSTFHANIWKWQNGNKEHGMIVVAMRRMNTISEEPFELELDVCPKCFRDHILSLKDTRKGRV